VARKTRYPGLSKRLMQRILSLPSRDRFEANVFIWMAVP